MMSDTSQNPQIPLSDEELGRMGLVAGM